MAWRLLAVLLLVTSTAWSAPGPHLRERLVGPIIPDRSFEPSAIALDLQCFVQIPGDRFCGGTYHCHRRSSRILGSPKAHPACPSETATVNFTIEPLDTTLGSALPDAGLSEIVFDAQFTNGVVCHFDGISQQLLASAGLIPAIQGRYACRDNIGGEVEGGVFSMRLTSFRRLSIFSRR